MGGGILLFVWAVLVGVAVDVLCVLIRVWNASRRSGSSFWENSMICYTGLQGVIIQDNRGLYNIVYRITGGYIT